MSVVTETGTLGESRYFDENGKEVYPCRCGKTHRGDYAFEDWNHHNCFHGPILVFLDIPGGEMAVCGECGASWQVKVIETSISSDKGEG